MRYGKTYIEKMMRHKKEYILELLIAALKREEKRTSKQNRALHLFFDNMAHQLNNVGIDCTIEVQGMIFISNYTGIVFKTNIWAPIQKTLYGTESTTELTTKQINNILDVLAASFSATGIEVKFPNRWDKIIEQMEKLNKL